MLLLKGAQELRVEHEALAEPSQRATRRFSHFPLRVGVKIVLIPKLGWLVWVAGWEESAPVGNGAVP